MWRRLLCVWIVSACVGGAPLLRAQQNFLAVNFGGDVFQIDGATGAGTLLGPSGVAGLNSMARDGAGTFFTVSGSTLLTIHPLTGLATPQVSLTFPGAPSVNVRGLAFSQAGVLYAIQDGGFNGFSLPDLIYTVDVNTGLGTLVGVGGFSGLQGLAFSASGLLYGWDVGTGSGFGAGLVLINPLTAMTTDVNGAVGGTAEEIQGLAFGTDGMLYGAGNALYTLDTLTGVSTLVGGALDVRGLEVVPEPSAIVLVLCGLGIGGVTAWRRRQAR